MNQSNKTAQKRGPRFYIGIFLLFCSAFAPLGAGLLAYTPWSQEVKLTLSGLFLVVIPEVFTFSAIAVLGKAGFAEIKAIIWGYLKRYAPPKEVGPWRYTLGLVMFVVPIIYGWAVVYMPVESFAGWHAHQKTIAWVLDCLLIASLLVLGAGFWDKIRALFVRTAKVSFE